MPARQMLAFSLCLYVRLPVESVQSRTFHGAWMPFG